MKNLILAIYALITACSADPAIDLTEANNSQIISATVGEDITISLNGNATTGYKWQFSCENGTLFKVIKEVYVPNKHPSGMVGVGGKSIYQIKPLQKGTFTIIARYYRPWQEFNPQTDKSVKFIIEVH